MEAKTETKDKKEKNYVNPILAWSLIALELILVVTTSIVVCSIVAAL